MLIGAGKLKLPPNVKIIVMQFSRLFFVVPMIFYAGLWSVKIAFLLFFRRLGTRSLKGLRYWWWVVLGITLLCYGLCYTTLPYRCCLVSYEVLASPECATQGWSFISMKVNCALDVFTDCLSKFLLYPFQAGSTRSAQKALGLSWLRSHVYPLRDPAAGPHLATTEAGPFRNLLPRGYYHNLCDRSCGYHYGGC